MMAFASGGSWPAPMASGVVRGDVTGGSGEPEELGQRLAELLRQRGAEIVLNKVSDAVPEGVTEREGGF